MLSVARRTSIGATTAAAMLAACGAPGKPDATPATAATAATTAATRDTVTLDSAAVQLAGFTIAPAEAAPWREQWTVPARLVLDPTGTQRLGSIAEGRVTRVLVNIGDPVRTGQVVIAVHSHEMLDAQSALTKAEAGDAQAKTAVGVAESAAQRAERLYAVKALSLSELERTRAALADARSAQQAAIAELTRARALHDHLVGDGPMPADTDDHEVLIRSPLDGVVVSRDAEPGMVVLVGAPLATVTRTSSLILSANVPERALAIVAPGAAISFTVAALPGERFTARVTRIAPMLDSTTRTVAVQASLRPEDSRRLRAEMYATAELLGAADAASLSVPADAVQALEGDTVVVVAKQQASSLSLEAVPVHVGRRTAARAEIVDGIAPGTPIVVKGAALAKAVILRQRDR